MRLNFAQIIFLVLLVTSQAQIRILTDLIQFNVAGHPSVHTKTSWYFDPDVGVRRSKKYQELNGKLGEKAIERLGLGIDGREDERLQEQRSRDSKLL